MRVHIARGAYRALSRTHALRRTLPPVRNFCAQAASAEAQGIPPPPSAVQVTTPKVKALLDELVSLNMLEVKELTDGLKDRLGIDDAAAMPMSLNPAMFAGVAPTAPAAEEEKVEQKSAFDLKLTKFDASKKIAVIKEIRALTSLGLKEAKSLVEDAPKVFKSEVPKEEAEQIRENLKEIGAEVVLE